MTRDPASDKSKALAAKGVEVVAGDLNDPKSLIKAFEGAHAAYGVTDFFAELSTLGANGAMDLEIQQGKNLANAAAATPTLEHYVWSSLPYIKNTTKGTASCPHFDGKAQVDEYIMSHLPDLAKKTTFFWPGYYATNLASTTSLVRQELGKYAWVLPCSPNASAPMAGLTTINVGVFVSAILAKPEITLPSKYVLGSVETLTMKRTLELLEEATGVEMVFVQKDTEDFVAWFPAGPVFGKELALNMNFFELGPGVWSKSGVKVLTKEDLGIKDSQLVSTKQAFEMIDWSPVIKA